MKNEAVDSYLEKRIKDKKIMLEMCVNDINSGKLSESELKDRMEFKEHCEKKIAEYKERLNR